MATRILASRAISAARKRLPLLSERELEETLSYAADSMAEAYRIGAAEAQQEIVARLTRLKEKEEVGDA